MFHIGFAAQVRHYSDLAFQCGWGSSHVHELTDCATVFQRPEVPIPPPLVGALGRCCEWIGEPAIDSIAGSKTKTSLCTPHNWIFQSISRNASGALSCQKWAKNTEQVVDWASCLVQECPMRSRRRSRSASCRAHMFSFRNILDMDCASQFFGFQFACKHAVVRYILLCSCWKFNYGTKTSKNRNFHFRHLTGLWISDKLLLFY